MHRLILEAPNAHGCLRVGLRLTGQARVRPNPTRLVTLSNPPCSTQNSTRVIPSTSTGRISLDLASLEWLLTRTNPICGPDLCPRKGLKNFLRPPQRETGSEGKRRVQRQRKTHGKVQVVHGFFLDKTALFKKTSLTDPATA